MHRAADVRGPYQRSCTVPWMPKRDRATRQELFCFGDVASAHNRWKKERTRTSTEPRHKGFPCMPARPVLVIESGMIIPCHYVSQRNSYTTFCSSPSVRSRRGGTTPVDGRARSESSAIFKIFQVSNEFSIPSIPTEHASLGKYSCVNVFKVAS